MKLRSNQAGVVRWRYGGRVLAVIEECIVALSVGLIMEELGERRAGVFEPKAL